MTQQSSTPEWETQLFGFHAPPTFIDVIEYETNSQFSGLMVMISVSHTEGSEFDPPLN